jgi:hypothetical protein
MTEDELYYLMHVIATLAVFMAPVAMVHWFGALP